MGGAQKKQGGVKSKACSAFHAQIHLLIAGDSEMSHPRIEALSKSLYITDLDLETLTMATGWSETFNENTKETHLGDTLTL